MTVQKMWEAFIKENPMYKNEQYDSFAFGNNNISADELAMLVKEGKKTATASGYCFYEIENEPLPKEGRFSIVLNSKKKPECIIVTTKVYLKPFNEVSKEHAYKEGEGDRSLDYWKEVHQEFFSEGLKVYNQAFDETMLIVCEEFKRVWK